MATNDNDIIPAIAVHPGSILKRELQERGMTQKELAKSMGMPAPNLSDIVKGKRPVTEAIAIKLEEALGISFQTWMNLQSQYAYVTKKREVLNEEEAKASAEEKSLSDRLNLKAIYKRFGVTATTSSTRLKQLKEALCIDLNGLSHLEVCTEGYFKRSDSMKIDAVNMRTWLLLAWSAASKTELDTTFNRDNCTLAASGIAELANKSSLTTDKIQSILNSYGIIYLHVPKLEYAPIDAYCVMSKEHPAIVVTYRYNDMDKLAFDILHELGHISKHLTTEKSFITIEGEYSSSNPEEVEANKFAKDMLIAPAIWKSIINSGSKNLSPHAVVHAVANEASKHGISKSIAVSRYKHDSKFYAIKFYKSPKIS